MTAVDAARWWRCHWRGAERADACLRHRRLHEVAEDFHQHLLALRLWVLRYFNHGARRSLQFAHLQTVTQPNKLKYELKLYEKLEQVELTRFPCLPMTRPTMARGTRMAVRRRMSS